MPSDDDSFATFMRFLDQPTPSTTEPGGALSIANGRLFRSIVSVVIGGLQRDRTRKMHELHVGLVVRKNSIQRFFSGM